MLFSSAVALIFASLTTAYDIQIHPEYQQGLAINDVPADRRLHWMRVANEVSLPNRVTLKNRRCTQTVTHVLKLPSAQRSLIQHRTSSFA